ncbi:hypothetical protein HYT01_01695 [Candidatus Giovannonibacteria bacterium]|nr:hypothetical protein [Candidatus Giovannonibacteria bacterium]
MYKSPRGLEYIEKKNIGKTPPKKLDQGGGSRLGPATGFLLIAFGIIIDLIEIFLDLIIIGIVLNWFIGIFTLLTFYVVLKWNNISMWEARTGARIMISLISMIFGEVVTAGLFPGWFGFALLVVLFERAREIPVVGKAMSAAYKTASAIK